MAEYSQEFKLNIVEEIEGNKFSRKEISDIYGIPIVTLDKWYDIYKTQGEAGFEEEHISSNKNSLETTSEQSEEEEFQIKVIEDMKNNNLSKFEIFKRYNVGMAQIALWKRKYFGEEDPQNEDIKNALKEIRTVQNKDINEKGKIDVNALLEENKRLKIENDYLRKINGLIKKRGN